MLAAPCKSTASFNSNHESDSGISWKIVDLSYYSIFLWSRTAMVSTDSNSSKEKKIVNAAKEMQVLRRWNICKVDEGNLG